MRTESAKDCWDRSPSYEAKKNVEFLTIGPPIVPLRMFFLNFCFSPGENTERAVSCWLVKNQLPVP